MSRLARMIEKACTWLLLLKELFRMERFRRAIGFSAEQTTKLMFGKRIDYSGTLYSEEYKRNFKADKVMAQVIKNSNVDRNRLFLHIDGQDISDWFKEQFTKLCPSIQPKQEQKRSKGGRL